jgi:hypothetical protein
MHSRAYNDEATRSRIEVHKKTDNIKNHVIAKIQLVVRKVAHCPFDL